MKETAKKVIGVATTLKFWAAIGVSIVGIYTTASFFGADLPRPAWSQEVEDIADDVIDLDIIVTEGELENKTLRLYQNQREQTIYRDEVKPVPDFLLEEQTTLEAKKSKLESRLRILRDKAAKR